MTFGEELLEFIEEGQISLSPPISCKRLYILFPNCCQRLVCLKVNSLETMAERVLDVTFLQLQSLIQLFQSPESLFCLHKEGIIHTKITFKNTPPACLVLITLHVLKVESI